MITRLIETVVPTEYGQLRAYGYREDRQGQEHLALVRGDVRAMRDHGVLTRVHTECLSGDVFGSGRCDCGPQLRLALAMMAEEPAGVLVYLRGHGARGLGLVDRLRAHSRQDHGPGRGGPPDLDLFADARDHAAAVAILADLGVSTVRLLTNSPSEVRAVRRGGMAVREQVPLLTAVTPSNVVYLTTGMPRLGHVLARAVGDPR
ncbi:GTP cyclohydrolase II [Pedococcus dokdonensis]|uniref:GTP cyclohydrolase II n=1 Tax=Pedococcus dokdonensis TaxID=443156 RepID=A0A1H0N759_9MICO|nr:GTP cyclohydrolase II [Pedococcus dokdonensis]SDO88517.1 GTP cyclohydrolase II [Pedococcus dokdonensis]